MDHKIKHGLIIQNVHFYQNFVYVRFYPNWLYSFNQTEQLHSENNVYLFRVWLFFSDW